MYTPNYPAETIMQEKSDLAETLKQLNNDEVESGTRFTSIDTRTRLYPLEIAPIIAIDSLVALGFLPVEALAITRSKKRLAVSRNGEGRKEWVTVASGRLEREEKQQGFIGK